MSGKECNIYVRITKNDEFRKGQWNSLITYKIKPLGKYLKIHKGDDYLGKLFECV